MPKFPLGEVVITQGVVEAFKKMGAPEMEIVSWYYTCEKDVDLKLRSDLEQWKTMYPKFDFYRANRSII